MRPHRPWSSARLYPETDRTCFDLISFQQQSIHGHQRSNFARCASISSAARWSSGGSGLPIAADTSPTGRSAMEMPVKSDTSRGAKGGGRPCAAENTRSGSSSAAANPLSGPEFTNSTRFDAEPGGADPALSVQGSPTCSQVSTSLRRHTKGTWVLICNRLTELRLKLSAMPRHDAVVRSGCGTKPCSNNASVASRSPVQ